MSADNEKVQTVAPPIPVSAPPPQLTAEHFQQISAARTGWKKLRRAVGVARFDGWSVGAFGAITVVCSLTSPDALALGLAMLAVAAIELRTAGRLGQLDLRATRVLAFNQLFLAAALGAYALWKIHVEMSGGGEYDSLVAANPELQQVLGSGMGDLFRTATAGLYAGLIGVAVFAQGSLSLYYFTRGRTVRDYLSRTPAWIISMQRAGVAL